jgi:adenine-specific DNA-methyltransferase
MRTNAALEDARLKLQEELDAHKSQAERNRLGQFATPAALANDILDYARTLLPADTPVRFIDPAIGTGAFYAALRNRFPARRIEEATGFEIDAHYGAPSQALWAGTTLNYVIGDFTVQPAEARYNLLISNPPYVRHHHLSTGEKDLRHPD